MTSTHKLALGLMIAASITACKKDDDPEPSTPATATTGTVKLEFEFFAGLAPYDLSTLLSDSVGMLMKFDQVRFYVSNAKLRDMGGNEIAQYNDKYLLVDAANSENSIVLGAIAPQHVHDITFNVGLDSLTNHQDPTQAEAPLNDATMHWGWNPMAGYKFIVLEGRFDGDGDDLITASDPGFIYHIATDALLGERMLTFHQDVAVGTTNTFAVHVDMTQVAAMVDVANNVDTHTTNAPSLAMRIRDALMNAMSAH